MQWDVSQENESPRISPILEIDPETHTIRVTRPKQVFTLKDVFKQAQERIERSRSMNSEPELTNPTHLAPIDDPFATPRVRYIRTNYNFDT